MAEMDILRILRTLRQVQFFMNLTLKPYQLELLKYAD